MKLNVPVFLSYLIFTLLILLSISWNVDAQNAFIDTNSNQIENSHVEWVNTWPSAENKKKSKRFKDRLNAFFFGIKPAVLINPVAILICNVNEFWVLDQGGKTIFQVQNEVGDIPQSVLKTEYDLSSLVGICSVSNTSMLFTDSKANKIFLISSGNKKLQLLNDTLKLDQPTGIAYLKLKKEIWVLETKAHRISVLNEKGELLKRIGNRGNAKGEFNYPTHIWIDKQGLIYINDAMNFRIQVLNKEGEVIRVFGENGDATGFFSKPKGIATDTFGNIYVVDALFHVVQVFDSKGIFLYKFGCQGHANSEFWMPTGIFIDDRNYIYVADTYNSRVQVFRLIHTDLK
jgi:DNA-binding beta-propeller fold protein YncE